jgi:cytidyltransferase-like protein
MNRSGIATFSFKARLVSELLEQRRVAHWLEFGSLLGAVRDGKSIPWDHDMDIGFFAADRFEVLGCQDAFRSLGFNVIEMEEAVVRLQPVARTSSHLLWIDLYSCRKRGSDVVPVGQPGTKFKFYHVIELERIFFEGHLFPCPRYREKLLALRYGETWRSPQQSGWEVRNPPGSCSTSTFRNEGRGEGKLTGYTEGVFDLFHVGHLNLLRRGKQLYDRLLVGVNSDATAQSYKRKPITPYRQRVELVKACEYVDEVVENAPRVTTLEFMDRHGIHYVLHGAAPVRWLDQFYSQPRKAGRLHLVRQSRGVHTTRLLERVRAALQQSRR